MTGIPEETRATGIALPDDAAADSMAVLDRRPAGGTTSVHRDIAAGVGAGAERKAWTVPASVAAGGRAPRHP